MLHQAYFSHPFNFLLSVKSEKVCKKYVESSLLFTPFSHLFHFLPREKSPYYVKTNLYVVLVTDFLP